MHYLQKRREANRAIRHLIGMRLRHHRLACGLTLVELGKAAGLSKSAVEGYETGLALPDLTTLVELAVALGITTDMLLHGIGRKAA